MEIHEERIRKILAQWTDEHWSESGKMYVYSEDLVQNILGYVKNVVDSINGVESCDTMTDERAIKQLQRSGWMAKHDAAMTCASLPDIVNAIMIDGNKSISVNIYPWKDDGNETT